MTISRSGPGKTEVRSLSQNLPFGLFSTKEEIEEESAFIGLGDVISWIT
jgi:hypothetical protein